MASFPSTANPRKGAEGNPLFIDNAEMLKAQSIARIMETVDIADGALKVSPAPKRDEAPAPAADTTGLGTAGRLAAEISP